MAILSTKKASLLGPSFVLAPERYDPRRSIVAESNGLFLCDVAGLVRRTVAPSANLGACLVLDTSDAREGIVIGRKEHTLDIGSTKKTLQAGDVIISRLRPYLRQVAYVDEGIFNLGNAKLLCSTEFFVLRSCDEQSIAFLVPFLLTAQVQNVLAASQEGGHHPRFDDTVLLNLPLSEKLLSRRESISAAVERTVALYRESEATIDSLVANAQEIAESSRTMQNR